jgi:hypothetical protein
MRRSRPARAEVRRRGRALPCPPSPRVASSAELRFAGVR